MNQKNYRERERDKERKKEIRKEREKIKKHVSLDGKSVEKMKVSKKGEKILLRRRR